MAGLLNAGAAVLTDDETGGPANGSADCAIAKLVNTSVIAADDVLTTYVPADGWSTAVTVRSNPCGVAGAGEATSTSPTCKEVTCAGAGASHVNAPFTSEANAFIVSADSTTVCAVVPDIGATGLPADPTAPAPTAVDAVTLNWNNPDAGDNPLTDNDVAEPDTVCDAGADPDAGV